MAVTVYGQNKQQYSAAGHFVVNHESGVLSVYDQAGTDAKLMGAHAAGSWTRVEVDGSTSTA